MSLPATVLLGVVGSFVGGTVWAVISGDGFDVSPGNIILAIIGAIVALLGYRMVKARTSA